MSTRVLAGPEPNSAPSSASDGPPKHAELVPSPVRRRRHTLEHGQDRLLRRMSRILGAAGALMIIWLLLRALGWI